MNEKTRFFGLAKKCSLVICLILCVFLIVGCSQKEAPTDIPEPTASTISVDITPENFEKYFNISIDVSNQSEGNEEYRYGAKNSTLSADVTLSIECKFPCELHNVNFSISAKGGDYVGSTLLKEKNLTFKGPIPQSGSYSSTKNVSFDLVGSLSDTIKYPDYLSTIKEASGFIVIDPRDKQ